MIDFYVNCLLSVREECGELSPKKHCRNCCRGGVVLKVNYLEETFVCRKNNCASVSYLVRCVQEIAWIMWCAPVKVKLRKYWFVWLHGIINEFLSWWSRLYLKERGVAIAWVVVICEGGAKESSLQCIGTCISHFVARSHGINAFQIHSFNSLVFDIFNIFHA